MSSTPPFFPAAKGRPQQRPQVNAFICGCGHSGTTIIANILAGHRQSFVPPTETNAFLREEDESGAYFRKLRDRADRRRRRVLIEKTPRHIHRLAEIRAIVPGARFIMPVRDGRDVAASIVSRGESLEAGIARWIAENEIVIAERGSADTLIYRYEDFVDDPEGVVRQVCRFLTLSYSAALLEYHRTPRLWFGQTSVHRGTGATPREHLALRNWQVNQPIFDGRGRWRRDFKAEDFSALASGRGGALMRAFGYL